MSREQMLEELLQDCNSFIQRSSEWRKNSYEVNWRKWQRNSDSIYDPDLAETKESWQSQAFVPITASHRENAQAQLFKAEVAPKPPLEISKRATVPEEADQSENIRDLILREREKSRYPTERNKVIEDKTTYGSGFCMVRFRIKTEKRLTREPIYEQVNVLDPGSIGRAMSGQRRVIEIRSEVKEVETYRGVEIKHISIWDIFPDPKALEIRGNQIAHRFHYTYGEIVAQVNAGNFEKGALEKLRGLHSDEDTPEDKKVVESDRLIADSQVSRTEYQKRLECYVRYARLPKKWVLINGEDIDDPEELLPAEVWFHENTVLMVRASEEYDGEPPIYKDDYMPVAGQFYGRGIPEMLKDVQLVSNEEVNQRIDAKTINLMRSTMIGIVEKALVNPKDIKNLFLGNIIRLKNANGINDIRQHLMAMDAPNVDRAAFIEPQEWERWAQERTSVNRQTLGTAGQLKDSNQTLGGMELLLASAGDKFAYLGMLSEFNFQQEVARAYWKAIYSNYELPDFLLVLGQERMQTFRLMSPEEIDKDYIYSPNGIYTMENKALRQARLAQIRQQFAGAPWLNDLAFFDTLVMDADEDPDQFKLEEAEQMQIQAMAQQMANQQLAQAEEQMKVSKRLDQISKAEEAASLAEIKEQLKGEALEAVSGIQ